MAQLLEENHMDHISIPKPMICTNLLIKSQSKCRSSWNLNTHDFLESVNWNYMISILKSMNLPKQLEPATVGPYAIRPSRRLGTGERYTRAKLGEMEGLREKQFLTSGKSTPKLLGWLFYMEGVLLFFGRSPANQYHQLIGW